MKQESDNDETKAAKAKLRKLMTPEGIGEAIRNNIANIVVLSVLLFLCLSAFVAIRKTDGQVSIIELLYNCCVAIIVYIPYRSQCKKSMSGKAPYADNLKAYGEKASSLADGGHLAQLNLFCAEKTEDLRREKRYNIMQRAMIDRARFDKLLDMTDEELENEKLTEKQKAAFTKATGVIYVKPINPAVLVTDSTEKDSALSLVYNETLAGAVSTTGKMISVIVFAVLTVVITVVPTGFNGVATFVALAMRILLVVSAIVSAIGSANTAVQNRDRAIKRRIAFIDLFYESLKSNKQDDATKD